MLQTAKLSLDLTDPVITRNESQRRPANRLVKQALQKLIETGQHAAGDVLPSETALANRLNVSVGTLRHAVDELVHEHILVRRQGKGTYVAMHSPARFMFQFFHVEPRWDFGDDDAMRLQKPAEYPAIECLSFITSRANAAQASALRIKPAESVLKIENRLLLALTFGDRPVEYRISTLNTQAHDYVSKSQAPAL